MRCFEGLVSSQRYYPNQELEIYNFRMVTELQISKIPDVFMVYIIRLQLCVCFVMNDVFWMFGELSSIPPKSELEI